MTWLTRPPVIMPSLLVGRVIKRRCCLSDVLYLSVAYIGPKWRRASPWNIKFGTQIADVTRNVDINFKVKRLKAMVPCLGAYCGGLHSTACFATDVRHCQSYYAPPLIGGALCDAFVWRVSVERREERVGGISWRPPAYSLFEKLFAVVYLK